MTMIKHAQQAQRETTGRWVKAVRFAALPCVHVGLAGSFTLAWFTAESESLLQVHVIAGYAMLAFMVLRLVLGYWGASADRLPLMRQRIVRALADLAALLFDSGRHGPSVGALDENRALSTLAASAKPLLPLMTLGIYVSGVLTILSGVPVFEQWFDPWSMLADLTARLHQGLGQIALLVALGHIVCVATILIVRGGNGVRPLWRLRARTTDRR